MNTYFLSPIAGRQDDRSWLASTYQGNLLVMAPTASAARIFANCAFALAIWCSAEQGPIPSLPWTQPDLVSVQELHHGVGAWDAPEGTVIVSQSSPDAHSADDLAA